MPRGERELGAIDLTRRCAILIGSEGRGVSQELRGAAIDLVLAQRAISSQIVDNLNASIHLRALLTDLFLIDEILKGLKQPAR